MDISIIIPTYNEAENIPILVDEIAKNLKEDYELIVVDDDSPDKTWQIAEKLKEKYPLNVLRRINKKGLSSAVLDGLAIAKGNILGVIDADLSHPPEKIPELINAIREGPDFVIGSRLIKGGKVEDWPFHRKFVSWGARILARPLTPIKDIMSGFFFIKKEVIENKKFKPHGYKIALEILIKGNYNKTKEIPIIFRNRQLGQSKLSVKIQLEYLYQLLDLYMYKLKKLFHVK